MRSSNATPLSGHIDGHAGRARDEEHAVREGERASLFDPRRERFEHAVDVWRFRTEAREQGAVDIVGKARFAPTLHRQAANDAESPTARVEERLDFQSRREDRIHRRRGL